MNSMNKSKPFAMVCRKSFRCHFYHCSQRHSYRLVETKFNCRSELKILFPQAMVCGSPEIPLSLLKSVATYKGIDSTSSLVQWFWEVMEEFSNQERSLFLRFVWGRTRLPRTIADFRGRDFVLQVLDKYNPPDHFLPESYTCFFLLKMPRYSCKVSGTNSLYH